MVHLYLAQEAREGQLDQDLISLTCAPLDMDEFWLVHGLVLAKELVRDAGHAPASAQPAFAIKLTLLLIVPKQVKMTFET